MQSFMSIDYFAFEIQNFKICDRPAQPASKIGHKNQYFHTSFRLLDLINTYKWYLKGSEVKTNDIDR
jgi:hypothetical protein